MAATMKDWNDKEIRIVKSRGGKISVCNHEDNLIIPPNSVWPHPDIVKKLYKSNLIRYFEENARSELIKKLGFYCNLQSLRSEDAITWSVFGTLHYFPKVSKVEFINSLLERIGEKLRVNDCSIQLWTRIAHPDTLVSGGPELDFQIVGDNLVILGEAKWTGKVAKGQGEAKNKDQLELRLEFRQKYGKQIFPKANEMLLLVVGLSERPDSIDSDITWITWEEICNKTRHPLENEVKRYYLWKKEYGR